MSEIVKFVKGVFAIMLQSEINNSGRCVNYGPNTRSTILDHKEKGI